jgi:hypothetical protein
MSLLYVPRAGARSGALRGPYIQQMRTRAERAPPWKGATRLPLRRKGTLASPSVPSAKYPVLRAQNGIHHTPTSYLVLREQPEACMRRQSGAYPPRGAPLPWQLVPNARCGVLGATYAEVCASCWGAAPSTPRSAGRHPKGSAGDARCLVRSDVRYTAASYLVFRTRLKVLGTQYCAGTGVLRA